MNLLQLSVDTTKKGEYMVQLAQENLKDSFAAMAGEAKKYGAVIAEKEKTINFTNHALTRYLIKLSALVDAKDEKTIGAYFHVLNDLERVGDHLVNVGYSILNPTGSQSEAAKN